SSSQKSHDSHKRPRRYRTARQGFWPRSRCGHCLKYRENDTQTHADRAASKAEYSPETAPRGRRWKPEFPFLTKPRVPACSPSPWPTVVAIVSDGSFGAVRILRRHDRPTLRPVSTSDRSGVPDTPPWL